MKDAKGHGSDAHSSGVQQVGQPKEYAWMKVGNSHRLITPDGNVMNQIGTVIPQKDSTGKTMYRGYYDYHDSTGNKPSSYAMHGSVVGAKKYVETNLKQFWEPPTIRK